VSAGKSNFTTVSSTKDYKELLEGIDAEAIMKGDAKAIVGGIN